jgi:hypothetical protein
VIRHRRGFGPSSLLKAQLGTPDLLVRKEKLAPQAPQDHKETQDHKDHLVAHKDPQEQLVTPDLLVRKEK